ncbi:hypothetical protein Noda2021_10040 [Candidatus Dependentiae bacterium Noda2021]|nr:hypothetical protein Noda2021_10040 [Candidatus Dependentiae bacterium Noda2021]
MKRESSFLRTLPSFLLLFVSIATHVVHSKNLSEQLQSALSNADISCIGQRIFRHECSNSLDKLIFWNPHEAFPSLGIGHFIWIPASAQVSFSQTFPELIDFLKDNGVKIPAWLLNSPHCPWQSRDEFLSSQAYHQRAELHTLLKNTIPLQAAFMVNRLNAKLNAVIQDSVPLVIPKVKNNIALLLQKTEGIFALVDYLNFKGDGLNSREHYNGHAWGLKQVLSEMIACKTPEQALQEFTRAAKYLLSCRIANAPRNEKQWRQGWFNRLESYLAPLT